MIQENFIGKNLTLASLCRYQKSSIVSKVISQKKTGSITLFAFDKGQALSEHTAPYDAFILIVDGRADIFIQKKKFRMKAGAMILLPANIPHAVKAFEKFKMLLCMIRSLE